MAPYSAICVPGCKNKCWSPFFTTSLICYISNGSYHSNNFFFWERIINKLLCYITQRLSWLMQQQSSDTIFISREYGSLQWENRSSFHFLSDGSVLVYGQGLRQGELHKMYFKVIKRPDRFRLLRQSLHILSHQ